jgi:lysophospholipase L1-like esterase
VSEQPSDNRFEVLIAKLRRRVRPALDLISTLLLVAVVSELVSFSVLTLRDLLGPAEPHVLDGSADDPRRRLDVYADAPWSDDYWDEFAESYKTEHAPYTGYRRVPNYEGRFIHLNERSLRKTTPDCHDGSERSLEIFFLGGSAAWGTGARDEATIPSWLARALCQQGVPVRVTNYGESGYTNTQELIQLEIELREGHRPDLVIFYDGVNDVYSSWQNGRVGAPQNVANRRLEYAIKRTPGLWRLVKLARVTWTGTLAERLLRRLLSFERKEPDTEAGIEAERLTALDQDTLRVLLENTRMVRALGREYDFEPFFFWQPAFYNKRRPSPDEDALITRNEIFGEMYLRVTELVRARPEFRDLSARFQEWDRTVFIDEFHISEEGNREIAGLILQELLPHVAPGTGPPPRASDR